MISFKIVVESIYEFLQENHEGYSIWYDCDSDLRYGFIICRLYESYRKYSCITIHIYDLGVVKVGIDNEPSSYNFKLEDPELLSKLSELLA